MNVDKTKIGIIIKSARVRDEVQEDSIRVKGASWILRIPKQVRSWRPIVNEVQPDDVVFVHALVLVPTEKGQDPRSPTSQIGDFVASVHANGGYIVECYTGLKSNIAKQRSAMLDAAMLGMRKGGRPLPAIGKDPGRPKTKWPSPEVEAEAKRIWKSVDYTTRAAAIRHMPKGVNSTLIKQLGPRGKLKTRRKT